MMLEELSLLLSSTPSDANFQTYKEAIIEENVLLKATGSTREKSFRYLRELYGLRPENTLFRVLRTLWPVAKQTRPQLAVICAVGRDPLLRSSASVILQSPMGTSLSDVDFSHAVQESFGNRLNQDILGKIGRNTASTWTQSGHLAGRAKKVRQKITPDPISTAYALFVAYLCGYLGDRLFDNDWVRLLDTPVHTLRELAQQAAQQGWLEYRSSGSITEISFRYFMKDLR